MIPILLYSHPEEPITKALLSSLLTQKKGFINLPLKVLLDEVSIIDEFDHEDIKIDWTLPSGLRITNSSDFYLINRVISVPEEIFYDFSEEDKSYSVSEFRAYLSFAIESFPNSYLKPGAFGLSGNRYSLPRQWETIRNSEWCNAIKTPEYYLGNMDYCNLKGDLVYSNPFDFYYWRQNRMLVDVNNASFVFIKPIGKSVVSFVCGDYAKIFCYEILDEISATMVHYLTEKSLLISRLFNHPIAEILFFIDGDTVTFGMISCIPYASSKKDWFCEKIYRYFETKLSCNNGKD